MIQRISVRLRITNGDRLLLVRRAEGRDFMLGKYELPGGRVEYQEQPEASAKRYLVEQTGIKQSTGLHLDEVITYIDSNDRNIQYVAIIYRLSIGKARRAIKLSSRYDKYIWYTLGKIDPSSILEGSRQILGVLPIASTGAYLAKGSTESDQQKVVVYSDGGSRGNPGPSAAGYVVIDRGEIIDQGGEYLGITTNNLAEYHGVRLALSAAYRLGIESVELRADSMLVVNQLNGIYTVKNRELWPINERVRELITKFKKVTFTYVPREMNQLADGMVNRTLNHRQSIQRKVGQGARRSMI